MFKLINDLQLIFDNFINILSITVHQWFKSLCKNRVDHLPAAHLNPPLRRYCTYYVDE